MLKALINRSHRMIGRAWSRLTAQSILLIGPYSIGRSGEARLNLGNKLIWNLLLNCQTTMNEMRIHSYRVRVITIGTIMPDSTIPRLRAYRIHLWKPSKDNMVRRCHKDVAIHLANSSHQRTTLYKRLVETAGDHHLRLACMRTWKASHLPNQKLMKMKKMNSWSSLYILGGRYLQKLKKMNSRSPPPCIICLDGGISNIWSMMISFR